MTQSEHSADSFVFRTDRPWPNARLRLGAVAGHTTPTSTRLWFRTGQPGKYAVLLYSYAEAVKAGKATFRSTLNAGMLTPEILTERLPQVRREDFEVSDYSKDTTQVVDLDGLSPDTRYGYLVYHRDKKRIILGHNRLRWFRTPPPESEQRPFEFALFSCHMPYTVNGLFSKRTEVMNLNVWDFLNMTLQRHKDKVDMVIAGGDQCYSDGVDTLNIWQHLNRVMRKENDQLLPSEETMCSWYRDVYRGYWGFESVQRVFERFPTYMIWDDHEIGDGWGSHYFDPDDRFNGVRKMLPDYEDRGLAFDEGRELMQRMFRAAKRTYIEYQHSHNPVTAPDTFDYTFRRGGCAFYVLDGRGQRDVERDDDYHILGREQFNRFRKWADNLTKEDTPFVFIVSAVPVLHTRSALVNADRKLEIAGLGDDLRDSWEHELHDVERGELLKILFGLAKKGIRVSILSGDVHVSAVFSMEDKEGNRIYQLTSSAITFNITRPQSWILSLGAADDGETEEGYFFRRLALYADSSYALISVDPKKGESWFKLYGEQKLEAPPSAGVDAAVPLTHSVAKIRLY